jgi:hypothetical protein
MAGIYSFIRGITGRAGIGVADEAVLPFSTLPNYSGIGIDRQVQRSFLACKPAYFQPSQDVPTVSPLGLTGLMVHGVPILGPLADKG